jgi:hypothetical protein
MTFDLAPPAQQAGGVQLDHRVGLWATLRVAASAHSARMSAIRSGSESWRLDGLQPLLVSDDLLVRSLRIRIDSTLQLDTGTTFRGRRDQ